MLIPVCICIHFFLSFRPVFTPHSVFNCLQDDGPPDPFRKTKNPFFHSSNRIHGANTLASWFPQCFSSRYLHALVMDCARCEPTTLIVYGRANITVFFFIRSLITERNFRERRTSIFVTVDMQRDGGCVLLHSMSIISCTYSTTLSSVTGSSQLSNSVSNGSRFFSSVFAYGWKA